jgi:uncharacterized protein YbjQ (UPF0145 family)
MTNGIFERHRKAGVALAAFGTIALIASAAQARDTDYKLAIADVVQNAEYRGRLGTEVAFYFGNQRGPGGENLGEYVANEKTNAFNKSDETACRWAMLSALLKLKQRAKKLGADAVVNVVSYYKKDEFVSDGQFDCHAGTFTAAVALKGTMIKAGAAAPSPAPTIAKGRDPVPTKSKPATSAGQGNKNGSPGDGGVLGLGVVQ